MKSAKINGHEIRILKRPEMDDIAWDECVLNSMNESPHGYCWVMDYLFQDWTGLVIGNYLGVMCLPAQGKILQMPYDVQNLGIFSKHPEIISLFKPIMNFLSSTYKFIQYSSGPFQALPEKDNNLEIRRSYFLHLNKSYPALYAQFSHGHKRNVKLFKNKHLAIESNKNTRYLLSLRSEMAKEIHGLFIPQNHNNKFELLMNDAISRNMGEFYYTKVKNQPVSAAFFLNGTKRSVILHASNTLGKKNRAAFGLVNHFIELHAGSERLLDFAGSDLAGVAEFNAGFGSDEVNYPMYVYNNLPYLLQYIKRHRLKYRSLQFIERLKKIR